MRDWMTGFASLLVVASVGVAVWCVKLAPPQMTPVVLDPVTARGLQARAAGHDGKAPGPVRAAGKAAPECGFGEVLIIAATEDPRYSSASVRLRDGETETLRRGESVAGHVVQAIHYDRVAFKRGGASCELRIGETPAAPDAVPVRNIAPRKPLPGWLAASIERVAPGELRVERSALERLTTEAVKLFRGSRVAMTEDGVKLSRVRGLLASLGFRRGDVLHGVNGFDLSDPQQQVEAYAKLMNAQHLTLTFSRGGKKAELDVRVI